MKNKIIVGILTGIVVLFVAGFLILNSISRIKIDSENQVNEDIDGMIVENTACSRDFFPSHSDNEFYQGNLFDAHFHMNALTNQDRPEGHDLSIQGGVVESQKNELLQQIICNFEKEKVRGVIGFVDGDEIILQETLDSARSIQEKSPEMFNLFLAPAGFSPQSLENIEQTDSGLFKGYGEIAFYHPSYADNPPDSNEMNKIYDVAEKYDLIIMMHPNGRQQVEVENAVKNNPNVKFLIHGPEHENYIVDLLNKYPNAYYSLDAILIRESGSPGALMYMVSGKNEFKSRFQANYDSMMNNAVTKWKPKIEQHPDRFMWGTDRADLWTHDEDVSIMIEEFTRDFIAKLDPSVQEKFAYQNAEALLD